MNPEEKEACREDFRRFCESYFPGTFYLGFSNDHLKAIGRIENSVLRGGLFALAMPRGSGKTSLCEVACIWATVYGHRKFIALIGATQEAARDILDNIKTRIESSVYLAGDFPEVCYPVQALEGINNRAGGQLYQGENTNISWTSDGVIFPKIAESPASEVIIEVRGITGQIRGMKHTRTDGLDVRPDLVIIDDPQTDESAASPSQVRRRLKTLKGSILGLAGPDRKIAGVMPCTVIEEADMADQILDREDHPEWRGEKTKLVYSFPDRDDLWDQYAEILRESFELRGDISLATEFYKENRKEMDRGAIVAWEERFEKEEGEISAIQYAMNLKIRDEEVFFAEYQNDPISSTDGDIELPSAEEIIQKTNGIRRGVVATDSQFLTAMIDVSERVLWWEVAAWREDFTGYEVDRGVFPDQKTNYVSAATAKRTLRRKYPGGGVEGALYAGITDLINEIMEREFEDETGGVREVDLLIVDANWGEYSELVYTCIRRSKHSAKILPMHGQGVKASSRPLIDDAKRKKPGERRGLNWVIDKSKHKIRKLRYDTNFFKSFAFKRLTVPTGSPGSFSLFKARGSDHQMYADQLKAEKPVRVKNETNGRTVDEWSIIPGRRDNHYLDTLAGNCVAASILGATLEGHEKQKSKRGGRKRMKLSAVRGNR